MKKLVTLLLTLVLLAGCCSITVLADEGIIAKFDANTLHGSQGGVTANGTSCVYDGTVETVIEDNSTAIAPSAPEGEKLYSGETVKLAYYLTIGEVENSESQVGIWPCFQYYESPFPELGIGQNWIDYATFEDYEGEKVIIVGIYAVPEDATATTTWFFSRLYTKPGMTFSVDKIVIADGNYNFANDAEYELIYEEPDIGGNMIPDEDDYTLSEETNYSYPTEEKIVDTIETNAALQNQTDVYDMKFEDLAAGVYKVAYYMTIDSARDGAQLRMSPRVGNYRCWIDWKTTEEMNGHVGVKTFMTENNTNKVILVNVITVPEDGLTIDAGYWQDENAYVGTLDKVVLATDGYDFGNETEYAWVDEKGYRSNDSNTSFGEDAEQKLLAEEGEWTMSTRAGADDNTGDNTGDEVPVTGDMSMIAILSAMAVSIGGMTQLKKKR